MNEAVTKFGLGSVVFRSGIRSDRSCVAFITESMKLVVLVETTENEEKKGELSKSHVVLLADLPEKMKPSSISFLEKRSIFVTDQGSPRVLEYRFTVSLLADRRTCPTASLIIWYMESGVSVGSNCRVTIEQNPSNEIVARIFGEESNGDSQGKVTLKAWPEPFEPLQRPINPDLLVLDDVVLTNSIKHFRILTYLDYDFPLFIRPSVTVMRGIRIGERKLIMLQVNETVSFYLLVVNQNLVKLGWAELQSVKSFECSAYSHFSETIHLLIEKSDQPVVEVCSIDTGTGASTTVGRIEINGSVKCMAIAEPLENEDAPVYSVLDTTGCIHGERVDNDVSCILINHENIFQVSSETISIEPRYIRGKRTLIPLPGSRDAACSIFKEGLNVGHCLVTPSYGPYRGKVWNITPTGFASSSCMSFCQGSLLALSPESGKISSHPLPSLPTCRISDDDRILWIGYIQCQEFISGHRTTTPDLSNLPSDLQDILTEDIFPTSIDCDIAAKKFLISFYFSKFFPNAFALSTEDVAWAGVSDSPDYILSKVNTSTWPEIRAAGIPVWCTTANGKLRDLVEQMHKSALQEYMKTKDPGILDDRVALWLSLLGKQQLLTSLYKQHGNSCASPAHTRISQFLGLDFSKAENAVKAVKNAFELVRQKRFGMAVAVFILAGAFQEAVDVCCRQMADPQLGLVLLQMLKTRLVGISHDVINSIYEQIWTSRLIADYCETGDVFLMLLWAWIKKESQHLSFQPAEYMHDDTTKSDFKVRNPSLCRLSIREYKLLVLGKLKRLQQPVDMEMAGPVISQEDLAISYLEMGCPDLATKLPSFSEFHASLKWAINHGIS
jgi:hypothetical protein